MICFELLQPRLIVGQDGVADQLVLLQLANHVAIVGGAPALFLRHHGRQRLHLLLDLVERGVRHLRQLSGRDVDAELAQAERIELRRLAEVGPRLRQDLLAREVVVGGDLRLQLVERLLDSPSADTSRTASGCRRGTTRCRPARARPGPSAGTAARASPSARAAPARPAPRTASCRARRRRICAAAPAPPCAAPARPDRRAARAARRRSTGRR